MSLPLSQREDGVDNRTCERCCGRARSSVHKSWEQVIITVKQITGLLLLVILEETFHAYQGFFEFIIGGTIGTADETCASSAK